MSIDFAGKLNELRQYTPEQWLQRSSAVLPPWISLVLVVASAWQLARLTWTVMPGGDAGALPPLPVAAPGASVSQAAGGGAGIDTKRAGNLFGQAADETAAPEIDEEIPDVETSLNLTLTATIAANNPDRARAIIADAGGNQSVYRVDETIQAGVRLHAIFIDQVSLNNRGKIEALKLPLAGDGSATPARSQPRRTTAAPSRSTGNQRTAAQRSDLREALARDPAKLTNLIRPQPVFANGKQLGYRVYPGRQRQEFARLGLKPGDLVTQINGTPLDDPARGLDIFRSLSDSTQVSVTVERNGTSQVLVLDTQNLNLGGGAKDR